MDKAYPRQGKLLKGRYQLLGIVGKGSTSTVYKAIDRGSKEFVVIKKIFMHQYDDNFCVEKESSILAELSHPNIIGFRDTFVVDNCHYLVTDFADGGNLCNIIDDNCQMSVHLVLHIGIQLVQAMSHLAYHSIIHQDIKPANLVIVEGRLCLCDFGLAQSEAITTSHNDGICGTISYCSPQILNGLPDASRDLWAVGITLYEMLAGHQPFSCSSALATITKIVSQPIPDIRQIRPSMPHDLGELVMGMLDHNPMCRLTNPSDILEYLSGIQDQYQAVFAH